MIADDALVDELGEALDDLVLAARRQAARGLRRRTRTRGRADPVAATSSMPSRSASSNSPVALREVVEQADRGSARRAVGHRANLSPVTMLRVLGDEVGRVAGDVDARGVGTRSCDYGAIGPRHRRARAFHAFGDGSMIAFPPTVIFGEGRIAIGAGTTIGPLASISAGMPSQADLRGDPIITIGDRCTLGKGIGIVGHERIEIGDDIWTGHYVYVTDQNHGYEDLDLPIGTQMWKNEPVSIGDG